MDLRDESKTDPHHRARMPTTTGDDVVEAWPRAGMVARCSMGILLHAARPSWPTPRPLPPGSSREHPTVEPVAAQRRGRRVRRARGNATGFGQLRLGGPESGMHGGIPRQTARRSHPTATAANQDQRSRPKIASRSRWNWFMRSRRASLNARCVSSALRIRFGVMKTIMFVFVSWVVRFLNR